MIANQVNMLCSKLNLSQHQFAKAIGYTQPRISQILDQKKAKISSKFIDAIIRAFPQVSRAWLTTGKGEMFVKEDNTLHRSTGGQGSVGEERAAYSNLGSEIDSMIRILVEIMQSDNKTVKEALKQNLVAFQYAVKAGKERDVLKVIINPPGCITTVKKG